jgi:rhodanese-related sulfurtransferase
MGTVHGVYLKYVGLSALSYAGYSMFAGSDTSAGVSSRMMSESGGGESKSLMRMIPALVFGYSTLLNGAIAMLFKMEWGMGILGKDKATGQIPLWSHILFFPFHAPTLLYTHVHTRVSKCQLPDKSGKLHYVTVPVASEVQPGWWVGGCYGHELGKEWGGVIDLTVEFPESCTGRHYLSAPTWDGVPLKPSDLESAATFAVEASKDGDVLVHCAHGRGRSTTVMCAALVKAGLFPSWDEAFEKGIKPFRPVCKLNKRMRENLTAWQAEYVDGKKGA